MTHDEMIKVIAGHRDGKRIQGRLIGNPDWHYCKDPSWDFESCEYELGPEPLVLWVNIYPSSKRAYESKGSADGNSSHDRIRCVKMVEEVE